LLFKTDCGLMAPKYPLTGQLALLPLKVCRIGLQFAD
jgi:hypothetical protein